MFAIWTIWKTKSKVSWETSCCALFSHDKLYPRVFGHIFLRRGCTWRVILNVLNLLKNWLTWCLRLAGQFVVLIKSDVKKLNPVFPSFKYCSLCECIRYIFSSNHNIHQSSCGLCFWAPDPLIDRFYQNLSIKGSDVNKQRPQKLWWTLWFDKKDIF